jgi:hypothetical protein
MTQSHMSGSAAFVRPITAMYMIRCNDTFRGYNQLIHVYQLNSSHASFVFRKCQAVPSVSGGQESSSAQYGALYHVGKAR